MAGPPVLEVEDLSVFRDGRRVVFGVSLAVAHGGAHLLVGPNGAGKSTLLAAVLGAAPFTGRIAFNWRGAGRIGWVPQAFTVDRTLPVTVGEFLTLSRRRRPVCWGTSRAQREQNATLLARVGLSEDFARRALGALSGGELQRVLVANAIDPAPELLLLDEPARGLDEAAVARLEDVLGELRREHQTAVLMVSHDLGQVRRLADRVTVLQETVRRSGPAATVLADGLTGA